jgi:hypothetical protein
MDGKPRTSLTEAKRASVIEAQRNSPGPPVGEGPRRFNGAVEEDISAAVEVGLGEHKSAAAEVGPAESAAAEAVVAAAVAAVGVDPTSASKKTSYR